MNAREQGLTLIELIVAIVIIAAAGATVLGLNASISQRSAEGMAATQRASIAKAYLDEILSRSFDCTIASSARADYDCVDDYTAISGEPVTDRFGNLVSSFTGYTVDVFVTTPSALSIVGVHTVPAAQMRRVEVRVTDSYGEFTTLNGVKTDHP